MVIKSREYKSWVSGGCGSTDLWLKLASDKTFTMRIYNRWMGGDNWEWNLIGTVKLIRVRILSKRTGKFIRFKRYARLNVKEIKAKKLDNSSNGGEGEVHMKGMNDIKIKMKVISMKEPKLTKLESGEEEWYGMGGSWNGIRDAVIIASNRDPNNKCITAMCNVINKCELTLSGMESSCVRREFFNFDSNDLTCCTNHKNLASVHLVFDNPCALSNKIISFLFNKLIKEEVIPETLYIDGSGECSPYPFPEPSGFPKKPIAIMTITPKNNFMIASHSTPYHLMQVIKTSGSNNVPKFLSSFNTATKKLSLLMDNEFKKESWCFKTDIHNPNNTYLFLAKACIDCIDCIDRGDVQSYDSVKVVCQVLNEGSDHDLLANRTIQELDFGKVSYRLIKDGKGKLSTTISSHTIQ
jgi:hypothetical protein